MSEAARPPLRVPRGVLSLPVIRPVATSMLFLAIVVLGTVAIQRMPIELFPRLDGDQIFVYFQKSGSSPEVVEREILIPLQSRISALGGIKETIGTIRGSSGNLQVTFEYGTDVDVREYEMIRIASTLQRQAERGSTYIQVQRDSTSNFDSFVMTVQVLGGDRDKDELFDLATEMIAPRFASVRGVAQATAYGGGGRQVTVTVDPKKTADLGVSTMEVVNTVGNNLGEVKYVGNLENEDGRTNVVLDGTTSSLSTLENARISANRPVQLQHLSEIEIGYGVRESLFRVNGQPAVAIQLFQEQGANLLELGRTLTERVEEVRQEIRSLGVDLVIGMNGAEQIEEQVRRLSMLGLTGFVIALLVLSLFLRQWRAVAVVGIAVPVSLTTALSFLYLFGYSINIITLFGLAMSTGLLVDNSIVVYEAILRGIERGVPPKEAARAGVKRTVRAIVAASLTTVIVFLPVWLVDIESTQTRQLMTVIAVSIIFPLTASLLVAIGLVPLLAHRLAAPAAITRVAARRQKRAEKGGLLVPDRARILLSGLVARALREPPAWLTGTVFAVIITVIVTLPWIGANSVDRDAPQADSIQISTRVNERRAADLEIASQYVSRIEDALLEVDGVEKVETTINESQATFFVQFVDRELRPEGFDVGHVRAVAESAAKQIWGIDVMRPGEDQGYSGERKGGRATAFMGGSRDEVVISGPDSQKLQELGRDIVQYMKNINYVDNAYLAISPGAHELWVEPNQRAMDAFGLTVSEAFPFLNLAGSRGQQMSNEFVTSSGREIPVWVEREGAREPTTARRELSRLRISTDDGVLPIQAFTTIRRMPPPPVIVHKNGRREMKVFYQLDRDVPDTGPSRTAIEEQIDDVIRSIPRPEGYVIDIPEDNESISLAMQLLLPVLGLLFLVLAMTFESLVLPFLLIVFAIPITVIGTMWGLALTGTPFGPMVAAGILVLAGLMCNPAILLVDRMQQLSRAGYPPGGAAYAAVKERTRPVLMTSSTTIAALWPLAITSGRENEIWPPFAIVVMSGLVTASILILIIVPVGYVLLNKLDRLFGRIGPWLVVGMLAALIAIMAPLIMNDVLESFFWIIAVTVGVGGALLALIVLVFRPRHVPEPEQADGPPVLEVSYLRKIYGVPGPIRKTLNAHKEFAKAVVRAGGKVFTRGDTFERTFIFGLLAMGAGALGWVAQSSGWSLIFWLVASGFVARIFIEFRKFRGFVNEEGQLERGGIEGIAAILMPWVAIGAYSYVMLLGPMLANEETSKTWFWPIACALVIAIGQIVRLSAVRQARGDVPERVSRGFLRYPRTWLRRLMRRIGGLDLPVDEVRALSNVSFTAKRGMIGILGPNGAGKTTLLRQLAGIIEPTLGAIRIGGVPLKAIRKVLARWIGYLPQDAGLPPGQTPREYLQYFAALYDIPPEIRKERVTSLIEEVGLAEKIDDKIGSLSGGMRQRVAVARTLLRLPPIIIVDEPTVGLDPRERIRFRNLLARLAENRIVLFSTHVVEDVAISCERVLVLAKSQLRFDGSPSELAQKAEGKVWEQVTLEEGNAQLPEGAILAEESPSPDGTTVQRVIWDEAPSEDAKNLTPRPEDGYLWLLATA